MSRDLHSVSSHQDRLFLLLLVLLLTLPFLNQAFHLDDQEFISFARVQQDDPLQFYLEDHDYMGIHFDVFRTTHPPVLSSLLATAMTVGDTESEYALHGVYLIFPIIAAFGMLSLSRRFTGMPLFASILLVTSMGFLVMSHNLRGDVPSVAMWLAATAVFIKGVDGNQRNLVLLSGALTFLAVMTSYQCLSLIPLMLLYLVLKKRLSLLNVTPAIATIVLFLGYTFLVWQSSGGLPNFSYDVLGIGLDYNLSSFHVKAFAAIAFIGGTVIFPASLFLMLEKKKLDWIVIMLGFVGITLAAILTSLLSGSYMKIFTGVVFVALFTSGLVIAYIALKYLLAGVVRWKKRTYVSADRLFLSVWFWVVVSYNLVFMPSISVRHLLPLFPPVILLFVQRAESVLQGKTNRLIVVSLLTVLLGMTLSVPAAIADYILAGSYRTAAEEFSDEYGDIADNVYFQGEFGFRYYMEKNGFTMLGPSQTVTEGDIIIRSESSSIVGAGDHDLFPEPTAEYVKLLSEEQVDNSFPVLIRTPWTDTGFYSHRMGLLPITVSSSHIDIYSVYLCE